MSKTFIHVGLHKTATTFFQNMVFPTLKNITYLSRPYTQLNHAFNKLQYADDTRFSEQEVLEEFQCFQRLGRKVLISDEMLSGVPNFNYINRSMIAQRLSRIFPDATIILFLRSQQDLILSLHNTWVKNLQGTRNIESFVHFPLEKYSYSEYCQNYSDDCNFRQRTREAFKDFSSAYYFCPDRFTLNLSNFFYYELVNIYKELFSNVHIFLFEDFRKNPSETLGHLEEILGDGFDREAIAAQSDGVNVSLKQTDLYGRQYRNAMKELTDNRLVLKAAELSGKLVCLLSQKQANKAYLSERLGDFYRENNDKLMQSYPEICLNKHPHKYHISHG